MRDPDMIPMVFLPISFGGFSYPVEKPKGTVKPEAPVRPLRPIKAAVDNLTAFRTTHPKAMEYLEYTTFEEKFNDFWSRSNNRAKQSTLGEQYLKEWEEQLQPLATSVDDQRALNESYVEPAPDAAARAPSPAASGMASGDEESDARGGTVSPIPDRGPEEEEEARPSDDGEGESEEEEEGEEEEEEEEEGAAERTAREHAYAMLRLRDPEATARLYANVNWITQVLRK